MHAYIINGTVRSPRQYWVYAGGANDARSASFFGQVFFEVFSGGKHGLFAPNKIKILARTSRAIFILLGALFTVPPNLKTRRSLRSLPLIG